MSRIHPIVIPATAILISFSGCKEPDARRSRLPTGTKATVYAKLDNSLDVILDDRKFVKLPVGTHVEVVSDEDTESRVADWRDVKINIREGEYVGRAATIGRHHIRPAKD